MGVKHLWSIIDEAKSKETLDYMRGKVISVDLSIWIVEAIKTLQFKTGIKKPHLRNIFYRILNLRRLGIKLVFVTEGEAPDLKQATMKRRNIQRYGVKSNTKKKVGRSRFQRTIQECCKMLDLLGLPHVQAKGEAEAMCAEMSAQDLTDGCLTNDGDFFLYGGKLIYRDFGIDPKDPHVFVYSMDGIKEICGLNREDFIGIGLLSGCDYYEGVPGVGKITLNRFIEECKDVSESVLTRIKAWKNPDCLDEVGKNEELIMRKAQKVENLYNEEIINEYMISKDDLSTVEKKFRWRYPDVKGIQDFLLEHLEWPEEYTLSKVLQLSTSTYLEKLLDGTNIPVPISPVRVVKTRCQQGVSLVEIEWSKEESEIYTRKWTAVPSLFTTLENQQVVTKVAPGIVESYVLSKNKKKKNSKSSKKQSNNQGDEKEEEKKAFDDIHLPKTSDDICPEEHADSVDLLTKRVNTLTHESHVHNIAESDTVSKCARENDSDSCLPLSERLFLKRNEIQKRKDTNSSNIETEESRSSSDDNKITEVIDLSSNFPQPFSDTSAANNINNLIHESKPSTAVKSQNILSDISNMSIDFESNSILEQLDEKFVMSFEGLKVSDSPCVIDIKKSYEDRLRSKFLPITPISQKSSCPDISTPDIYNEVDTVSSPLALKERLKLFR